jgi:4-hydroxybenzoate polyprenyltransferase
VWTQAVAAAVGLVWAFRLWDDLADLAYDRIHHPERKLVSSTTRPSFAAALGIVLAAAVGALVLAERPRQALALGLLCAFLAAVYLPWRGRVDRRLMRAHLVLAKYPVFIYVAAVRPVSTTVAMIAGAAYLALCVIEILDDPALRRTVAARVVATAEAVAFVGIVAAGALR